MIPTHEIFLLGEPGTPEFKLEVNWKPDDAKTNKCQIVRFTFPDGQQSYVTRDHLLSVLFAIGKPDQQVNMVPQKVERIRNYETTLGIKATKDIRKGEHINVAVKIPIPLMGDEIIGAVARESKIITPRA